jgi:hypothetical protein
MNTECPECKHCFQTIDVDGVMSERRLIHEVLEESREVKRLRDGIKQIISRPDFTNPEFLVMRLRDLLENAGKSAQTEE